MTDVKEEQVVAKLSGFNYEYTGELEGAVPGVGLVKRGQVITPTHAEHEQAIRDSRLFKRVPKAAKAQTEEAAPPKAREKPAPKESAPKESVPEAPTPEEKPAEPETSGKEGNV